MSPSTSCQPGAPGWFARMVALPTTHGQVDVGGAQVHYRCWNPDDVEKPLLLFVHGFLAHSHWWDFVAPFLIGKFCVVAMDFSGMGESSHRDAYTAELWSDEIVAIVRHLDRGPASLVAHSFGGARALEACSVYPALFNQLIVLDAYIHFDDHPPLKSGYGPARQPRFFADIQSAMARYRLVPEQPVLDYILSYLAQHSLTRSHRGWTWKFDQCKLGSLERAPDSTLMLTSLGVPTTLVHGQYSRLASPRHMQRVNALLRVGRGVVEIPEAHHHVMLDQPLAIVACLRTLLSSTSIS
ncbi:pimeloyl-ACP methyl ester carboxylesterase [Pseudomonas sp. JAI111]|uniref:alpha/beta fold hydrolase n=1 Tax=Pseudomonas sp. JAI111 TaxID=2735913 RepID=UPI002166D36C|nr:alpha/beta hydrolase [Pseudomonas sp. JAI111]MCS3835701.1 pimeloyl-ACP methyl ester carboxylesterase [Pseudomonas sp. JAI111]